MAADHRRASVLANAYRNHLPPSLAYESTLNIALAYAEAVTALRAAYNLENSGLTGPTWKEARNGWMRQARAIIAQLPEG